MLEESESFGFVCGVSLKADRTVGLWPHTEDHCCTPDDSLTLALKPTVPNPNSIPNPTYPTSLIAETWH